ncbi:methylated-DNA--[protein]-cysteine S-methyltransferase [Streptomyces benahoarensis]|uniref:methylated-DNA--[protein]-cysteine S-methyltransferase n=1 Tax=Streptomyces benahoarensis TaxID=2595054 RepID=A0A553ZNL6_9ACTN|nr:methylated-DNA--[protein]-cysteine S-methyltransferase [Streptomyces benahoarensis]TSB25998.1 methylated-DNA--[protein]-cysteine S-methyltransferase [Streptomyces benahoarensis]TSB43042.1 methylated-DNA--[protein]-cysteine S-methyltransferase [Streptomyces benahoarensis]
MSRKKKAEPESVGLATQETAVGRMTLAVSDEALLYCGFAFPEEVRKQLSRVTPCCTEEEAGVSAPQQAQLAQVREQLADFLAGRRRDFALPMDLRLATPFCREVVLSLTDLIPYGHTLTYAQLAERLGRPGGARAVGVALGANPLCVVLPCHRVVGASGKLTGYAGGLAAKRLLLELEAGA